MSVLWRERVRFSIARPLLGQRKPRTARDREQGHVRHTPEIVFEATNYPGGFAGTVFQLLSFKKTPSRHLHTRAAPEPSRVTDATG
jgi:hypothetical protein